MVKKSSWSEHTWSTFILRAEEESEPILLGKQLLSQFQKDKFIHFFYHVLDLNMDHVISQVLTGTTQCKIVSKKVVFQEDFDSLNSRVRHYMQWNSNNPHYLTLNEVHKLFIDYFLQFSTKFVKKEEGFDFGDPFSGVSSNDDVEPKTSVSIDEWVDVWGEL